MSHTRQCLVFISVCLATMGCNYYECDWHQWDDHDDDRCVPGVDCPEDAGGRLDAGSPIEADAGGAPSGCALDMECASGQLCVEGACRAADEVCHFDVECGPGRRCVDAACRPMCTTDAECPSGTRCEAELCLPAVECASDGECGAGERCVDQRCLPTCETECAHAEDVCGPDGLCRPDISPRPFCASDADCAEGRMCLHGVCRTPCPSGEDIECLGWDSQFVRCGMSDGGLYLCYTRHEWDPECRTAADCAEGRSCIDAICH